MNRSDPNGACDGGHLDGRLLYALPAHSGRDGEAAQGQNLWRTLSAFDLDRATYRARDGQLDAWQSHAGRRATVQPRLSLYRHSAGLDGGYGHRDTYWHKFWHAVDGG